MWQFSFTSLFKTKACLTFLSHSFLLWSYLTLKILFLVINMCSLAFKNKAESCLLGSLFIIFKYAEHKCLQAQPLQWSTKMKMLTQDESQRQTWPLLVLRRTTNIYTHLFICMWLYKWYYNRKEHCSKISCYQVGNYRMQWGIGHHIYCVSGLSDLTPPDLLLK